MVIDSLICGKYAHRLRDLKSLGGFKVHLGRHNRFAHCPHLFIFHKRLFCTAQREYGQYVATWKTQAQ
jgi:hypothetical protein